MQFNSRRKHQETIWLSESFVDYCSSHPWSPFKLGFAVGVDPHDAVSEQRIDIPFGIDAECNHGDAHPGSTTAAEACVISKFDSTD